MSSFFFKDAAPTEIYPLSLHDALPISPGAQAPGGGARDGDAAAPAAARRGHGGRSEEHTSELQSRLHLVCRLFFLRMRRPPRSTLFPSTTLFRSLPERKRLEVARAMATRPRLLLLDEVMAGDRKSTRLNSSHGYISYVVFFF